MDEKLKATITQRLDELPDETARQLLDYIEFLESKYNRSTRDRSPFERLADNVEGTLRATRIGEAAIKGTSSVFDAASSVMKGVADAGRVVVDELQKLDLSENEQEAAQEKDAAAAQGESVPSNGEEQVEPKAAADEGNTGQADSVAEQPSSGDTAEREDEQKSA